MPPGSDNVDSEEVDMIEAGGEKHKEGTPLDDYADGIHRDSPVFIDQLLFYATQPCKFLQYLLQFRILAC